ncbi:MAG: cation-transporting P-type ATPase, partial [Oscillospiraceae bacterium]
MTDDKNNLSGISTSQAEKLQEQYGKNELAQGKKQSFFRKAIGIFCEPMFLLLIVAAIIYFILGEPRDGAIMLV